MNSIIHIRSLFLLCIAIIFLNSTCTKNQYPDPIDLIVELTNTRPEKQTLFVDPACPISAYPSIILSEYQDTSCLIGDEFRDHIMIDYVVFEKQGIDVIDLGLTFNKAVIEDGLELYFCDQNSENENRILIIDDRTFIYSVYKDSISDIEETRMYCFEIDINEKIKTLMTLDGPGKRIAITDFQKTEALFYLKEYDHSELMKEDLILGFDDLSKNFSRNIIAQSIEVEGYNLSKAMDFDGVDFLMWAIVNLNHD